MARAQHGGDRSCAMMPAGRQSERAFETWENVDGTKWKEGSHQQADLTQGNKDGKDDQEEGLMFEGLNAPAGRARPGRRAVRASAPRRNDCECLPPADDITQAIED